MYQKINSMLNFLQTIYFSQHLVGCRLGRLRVEIRHRVSLSKIGKKIKKLCVTL